MDRVSTNGTVRGAEDLFHFLGFMLPVPSVVLDDAQGVDLPNSS